MKTKEHTSHYACKEIIDKDGDKAVGCCCTGHNCKIEVSVPKDVEVEYIIIDDE